MKAGWKTKSLKDACQFSSGLWKGEKPPFLNVGVIRNTNFTKEGTLDDSDIAYLDVEAKKLEKRRLQFGDIILEKSGGGPKQPVGRVALFDKEDGDFSFSNFTAALRVLDPHELDFSFLHKFLHWSYLSGVTEGMQSHSTGIRNLDGDAYKAIRINFPLLPEQHRIVGILNKAFEGIATAKANAENNLKNAHALFESHIDSVFTQRGEGWPIRKLGELSDQITDGTHNSPAYVESGIPMLDSKHVQDDFSIDDSEPEKFISPTTDALLAKRCKPRAGDILISSRGSIGKIAIVRDGQDFNIMGNMILIRLPAGVSRAFAAFYLRSQVIHIESIARGVAQKGLYLNQIRDYELPLPAETKQAQIGTQLDALGTETQRLESIYKQKLAALEELKKSLLHQAFTGEL